MNLESIQKLSDKLFQDYVEERSELTQQQVIQGLQDHLEIAQTFEDSKDLQDRIAGNIELLKETP